GGDGTLAGGEPLVEPLRDGALAGVGQDAAVALVALRGQPGAGGLAGGEGLGEPAALAGGGVGAGGDAGAEMTAGQLLDAALAPAALRAGLAVVPGHGGLLPAAQMTGLGDDGTQN